jgi:hypothetical protein
VVQDGEVGRDTSDDPAWADAEPEELLGRPGRRWPWWLPWLLVAALVVVLVVALTHKGKPSAAPSSAAPSSGAPSESALSSAPTASGAPDVTRFALSLLLGETGGWELFGRGPDSVVRLEIGADRIVRTPGVGFGSGGPVSFVVGSHEAIVRPLDNVPGFAVPDDQPARRLPAALSDGGIALPGPDPDHVWRQTGSAGRPGMTLIGLDGRPSGTSIPIPAGFSPYPAPDGAGYLLLARTDGRAVYDARPGTLRRVTTGTVLAVGPSRWVVRECVDARHCATAAVDQASGARHVLRDVPGYEDAATGLISPDGATAALTDPATGTVHLVTLADGADLAVEVSVDIRVADGTYAWSPDSRWLFVADRYGDLAAVERRSGRIRHFGTVLPELSQLAVRPAPR